MRSITLADLLACDERGMMLVAEDRSTSRPVHIEDAVRGLQCDCVCSACKRPLVARKGSRRHSFAHYPEDVKRSCVAAGESYLHQLAKEVLAEERYIFRPKMVANDDLGELVLKPAGRIAFDRVELELSQGDVVPDVVCYRGDRKLYVEFKVTHAVDEEKRRKLKHHQAAVLEIDLSGYRDRDLKDVATAILVDAPRMMLQSEILDQATTRLEERRTRLFEEIRTQAHPLALTFRKPQCLDVTKEEWYSEAARYGFFELIEGQEGGGSAFTVPVRHWQAWVLWRMVNAKEGFSPRQVAYQMLSFGWVKRILYETKPELSRFIRAEIDPGFKSAVEAVQDFLNEMKAVDLVYSRNGKRFFAGGYLRRLFAEVTKYLGIPNERQQKIEQSVSQIIKVLPITVTREFSFEAWIESYAASRKVTLADLFSPETALFDTLEEELTAIRKEMGWTWREPDLQIDMIGLPLADYFAKKRQAWVGHQEQQRLRREEQVALDAINRVERLQRDAWSRKCGGEKWLTASVSFDGRESTPVEHARLSAGGASEMHRLLSLEQQRYEDQQRFERIRSGAVAELVAKAGKAFGTPERAKVWVESHLRELGMKRPVDYCVDEKTLAECLSLLPLPKRR